MSDAIPETPAEKADRQANVPLFLRFIARAWWSVIAFLGAALLGNVLLVFLAQGPDNWWPTIESQVGEVRVFAKAFPVLFALM